MKKKVCTTALKRNLLVFGIVAIIAVLFAVGVFFAFKAVLGISPQIYDENAVSGVPDITEGTNEYTWIDNPEVGNVAVCLKAVADGSRKRVAINLTVSEDVVAPVKIEAYEVIFYYDSEGKLAYRQGKLVGETGFVKAGEHVVYMELKKKLDPAEFNGDQYPVLIKVAARDDETGKSVATYFIQGAFYLE